MRYVTARLIEESRDLTYRIYVTDALKVLENGSVRYIDLIQRKYKEETRSPEEIVDHIRNGLLKMGG